MDEEKEAKKKPRKAKKAKNTTEIRHFYRRSAPNIKSLLRELEQALDVYSEDFSRVIEFWPTTTLQTELLFQIAKDIPTDANPLKIDPSDDDGNIKSVVSSYTINTSDSDSVKDAKIEARSAELKCIEWLGLLNKENGHAAVKIQLPATYEPWVTYVNRLLAYLYLDLPSDAMFKFEEILNATPNKPLTMKCENPRCVKLSHMKTEPYQWDGVSYGKINKGRVSWKRSKQSMMLSHISGLPASDRVKGMILQGSSIPESDSYLQVPDSERTSQTTFQGQRPKADFTIWSPGFEP